MGDTIAGAAPVHLLVGKWSGDPALPQSGSYQRQRSRFAEDTPTRPQKVTESNSLQGASYVQDMLCFTRIFFIF